MWAKARPWKSWTWIAAGFALLLLLWSMSKNQIGKDGRVTARSGVRAVTGGSPTVRKPYYAVPDDPDTTNDESNDQPRGHFGTVSLLVTNVNSGNSYPLDADVDDNELTRLYFPKGGWIDFLGCELDEDLTGFCEDENGRSWNIQGEH